MPGLLNISTASCTSLIKSLNQTLIYESACSKYMAISETLETNFLIQRALSPEVSRVPFLGALANPVN